MKTTLDKQTTQPTFVILVLLPGDTQWQRHGRHTHTRTHMRKHLKTPWHHHVLPLQLIAVISLSLCTHAARMGVSACARTSHLDFKTQKDKTGVTWLTSCAYAMCAEHHEELNVLLLAHQCLSMSVFVCVCVCPCFCVHTVASGCVCLLNTKAWFVRPPQGEINDQSVQSLAATSDSLNVALKCLV